MPTIGEGVIKIRSDTADVGSGIASALGSVGKVAAASFTVASAAAVGFGVAAFQTAARVGEMDAALGAIAKATGLSKTALDEQVKTVRATGVTMSTAQGLVAQFARSNMDMAKATDLARTAQDLAILTQQDSSETLNELLHGIQTGNVQLGVFRQLNINATDAQTKFAATIGKSRTELTQSEKQQALLNAVIEAGVPIAGTYAAAMQEPGKVLRSFPRIFDDIKLAVGKPLLDAFGPTILKAYDFAKALSASLQPGGALNELVVKIGEKLHGAIKPLTDFIDRAKEIVKTLKPGDLKGISGALDTIGPAASAAGAGFFAFGAKSLPVIGGLLGGINPLAVAVSAFALTNADLRDVLGDVVKELIPLGRQILDLVMPAFNDLVKAASPLLAVLLRLVPLVVEVAGAFLDRLLKAVTPLLPLIAELASIVIGVLEGAFLHIVPIILNLVDALGEVAKIVGEALLGVLRDLEPVFHDLMTALAPLVEELAKLAGTVLKDLAKAVEPILPVLGDLVGLLLQGLAPVLQTVAGLLEKYSDYLTPVIAAFLGLYGAVQLLTGAQGIYRAISAFKLTEVALYKMGAAAWASLGPWGILAGAIVALGVGLYVAYQKFEPFRNIVDTVGRFIGELATGILGFVTGSDKALQKLGPFKVLLEGLLNPIRGMLDVLKGLITFLTGVFTGDWAKAWDGIKQIVEGALRYFLGFPMALATNFGPAILGFFAGLGGQIGSALADAAGVVGDFFAGLADVALTALDSFVGKVRDFFVAIPGVILDALKALPGLLVEAFETAIALAIAAIAYQVYYIPKFFAELVVNIVKALAELGPKLAKAGGEAMVSMAKGIADGAVAVWDFFLKLPGRVQGYLSAAGGWLVDAGARILNGLADGITTGAQAVWNFLTSIPGRIKGFFVNAWEWLFGAGKATGQGLADGTTAGVTSLWDWLARLPRRIGDYFLGARDWLFNAGQAIIQGLINGITSMIDKVGDSIGRIGDKIKRFLPGSPAKEGPLAGHGSTFHSGVEMMAQLAKGIESMVPTVGAAMNDVVAGSSAGPLALSGPQTGPGGPGQAGPGGATYVLNIYPQTVDEIAVLSAFHRLELIGAIR
jgi:phage-related protein